MAAVALIALALAGSAAGGSGGPRVAFVHDGQLYVVDLSTRGVQHVALPQAVLGPVAWSGDGKLLSDGGAIVGGPNLPTSGIEWAPTGETAAYQTSDGALHLWTPSDGSRTIVRRSWGVRSFAWGPNGQIALGRKEHPGQGVAAHQEVWVWQNGTLLHSFVLDAADAAYAGTYMGVFGTENSTISVYLAEGNIRIDNYILDNNKTGLSLVDSLVGNKKFWFFDSNDQIEIVQKATEVNTALTPYLLAILNNHSVSEMGAITRLRVEGAEISEVIDEEMMAEYGNLFHYVNIPEILSQGDADYYAALNMAEAGSRYEVYTLQGAADPRIEPQDVIYVNLPEGIMKVLVDEITFTIDVQAEGGPVFDMTINGRVLRSDL